VYVFERCFNEKGGRSMWGVRDLASAVLVAAAGYLSACGGSGLTEPTTVATTYEQGLDGFPARLDSLRVQLRIPGMSVALVHDGNVVWATGLGLANAERGVPATGSTPFHLASLTKPFAATVLMQLVEAGVVDLDAPVSEYGVDLASPGVIRVRHLLTHTSEGVPGSHYQYSGERFGYLTQVMESATGQSFGKLLVERILQPLGLSNTAPNPRQFAAFAFTGLDRSRFTDEMAAGYERRGAEVVPRAHPTYFGAAAGLVASAEDVAAFSVAISQGRLLDASTWAEVFTPAISITGDTLPYGLGWFIQSYQGVTLQWHYGYWSTNSSLIVRAPEKGLAFVVLANTPQLSAAYPGLGSDNNVLRSGVAQLFVDAFVLGDEPLP
jgi:CubicO group peptidase (beta-lactamase class C family)